MSDTSTRLSRSIRTCALLAILAACSGGSGETAKSPSPSLDPAQNPSIEGQFAVGVDGRKDALVCWGTGKPAVLLETGGTNIEEWSGSAFVSELAPITRVCTYDRAGTGKSDAAPNERRDADDVVTEASALLKAAHVGSPLVLVGRSFGGMVVTHYAETMPGDVLGVVVYDTPAPSAEFTEESAPELVWDAPGNTEHLDVVGGFENRFAKDPPHFDVPLLLITPNPGGEASSKDESFWLQASPESRQVELPCGDDEGPCATEVATFVKSLQAH
jgi:pimeloyl-ACP methyl ester carboxylesterase